MKKKCVVYNLLKSTNSRNQYFLIHILFAKFESVMLTAIKSKFYVVSKSMQDPIRELFKYLFSNWTI